MMIHTEKFNTLCYFKDCLQTTLLITTLTPHTRNELIQNLEQIESEMDKIVSQNQGVMA